MLENTTFMYLSNIQTTSFWFIFCRFQLSYTPTCSFSFTELTPNLDILWHLSYLLILNLSVNLILLLEILLLIPLLLILYKDIIIAWISKLTNWVPYTLHDCGHLMFHHWAIKSKLSLTSVPMCIFICHKARSPTSNSLPKSKRELGLFIVYQILIAFALNVLHSLIDGNQIPCTSKRVQ